VISSAYLYASNTTRIFDLLKKKTLSPVAIILNDSAFSKAMLAISRTFLTRRTPLTTPYIRNQIASMITITEGVEFDTIAREWRCKWTDDDDKGKIR